MVYEGPGCSGYEQGGHQAGTHPRTPSARHAAHRATQRDGRENMERKSKCRACFEAPNNRIKLLFTSAYTLILLLFILF